VYLSVHLAAILFSARLYFVCFLTVVSVLPDKQALEFMNHHDQMTYDMYQRGVEGRMR
jgi:hypothetical protein